MSDIRIWQAIALSLAVMGLSSCSSPRIEPDDSFGRLQDPLLAIGPDGEICDFVLEGRQYTDLYNIGYRFLSSSFSPDQRYFLTIHRHRENARWSFEMAEGDTEIFLVDLMTGEKKQLTDNAYNDFAPAWSPNGHWVGFSALDDPFDTAWPLRRMRPEGGQSEILVPGHAYPFSWSPSGEEIVFEDRYDLILMSVNGQQRETLVEDGAGGGGDVIAWSPNGQFVTFNYRPIQLLPANGTFSVYNFSDGTITELVNTNRILSTAWSPDSEWIVFESGFNQNNGLQRYMIHPDGTALQVLENCNY